jgi:hypothetical protein
MPDKLFRNHLEHFKKSPPPQAWSRIETGLKTKSSSRLWIGIAASVLVLLCTSFLLWHSGQTPQNVPSIVASNIITHENPSVTSPTPLMSEQISSSSTPSSNIQIVSEKSKPDQKEKNPSAQQIAEAIIVINDVPGEKTIDGRETSENIISSGSNESVVVNDIPSTTSHSNKITYSSGEVNSRFLKKDSTASVPAVEKTSAGFQKIRDIAADLKDEAAFGELRQMKNEILSFPIKELTKDK